MSIAKEETGLAYRLRKGESIGELAAEDDKNYLSECFIDAGFFQKLRDCHEPQRIILGRTGSGKSALIEQLKLSEENVIEILPENLSLNHLSNSNILTVLSNNGVDLNLFYTLLWRHVFTVELLKQKFDLKNKEKTQSWLTSLFSRNKEDERKNRAIRYFSEWGEKFWEETECRIKETTEKFEGELKAAVGADFANISGGIKTGSEEKNQFVQKAQAVVNKIQIRELTNVIEYLNDEVFSDDQQRFYIVIDKLDERWVENNVKYSLIRALIETVQVFRRSVRNVKIIVALRLDLIQSVLEKTKSQRLQQEKYESLFLNIQWNRKNLEDLLDKRIAKLLSEKYTKQAIGIKELFPSKVRHEEFIQYLMNRTLLRPRDAISFVNECLKLADGSINVDTVCGAENLYSKKRLQSLSDEWESHYPCLEKYIYVLEGMPYKFLLRELAEERFSKLFEKCIKLHNENDVKLLDPVFNSAYGYIIKKEITYEDFVLNFTLPLFKIGILGIFNPNSRRDIWAYSTENYSEGERILDYSSTVLIHPIVWSALSITPK